MAGKDVTAAAAAAATEDVVDDGTENQPKARTHANQSAASLDKVTDKVEEKTRDLDNDKLMSAMSALGANTAKKKQEMQQREQDLAKIKVDPAHIKTIEAELELDESVAERRLRENGGDLVKTLRALVA